MIILLIIVISILMIISSRKNNTLYVIIPLFNPSKYGRRNELHAEFIRRYTFRKGVKLITVEAVPVGSTPIFRSGVNHKHISVDIDSSSNFWLKENLINIGIESLPKNWKYVSWIDGDILFVKPNWVEDTKVLLDKFNFIQMFSQAVDVTHDNIPYQINYGYVYEKYNGQQNSKNAPKDAYGNYLCDNPINYVHNHSGYAWAMNREAWEVSGGLMDRLITGAADRAIAYSLFGEANQNSVLIKDSDRAYKEYILNFQRRVKGLTTYYMEGSIIHYFHGAKKYRGYMTRPRMLIDHKFNPYKDLLKQENGVYKLNGQDGLKTDLRNYFNSRNENSIEL